jgi:hypothetical protein
MDTIITSCQTIFFPVIAITYTRPAGEIRCLTGRFTCGIPLLLTFFLLNGSNNPKADDIQRDP